MMSRITIRNFKSVMRERVKHCQNGGVAQVVVVLTHKEINYLVIGQFDVLVAPLSY